MNIATVEITKVCPFCGKVNRIIVNAESYRMWQSGALIQRVFPMVSATEREILMSGICEDCQDDVFGKESEDD